MCWGISPVKKHCPDLAPTQAPSRPDASTWIATCRKLRYYAKYATLDSRAPDGPGVPLYGVTRVTAHDGEVDFYRCKQHMVACALTTVLPLSCDADRRAR